MRTAFIGDVGGHREPFERLLTGLGCDVRTGAIPDGLTVVQLGDLIHRGPDSAGVIRLVERFIDNPGWVQLVGNHEAQYLRPGGPLFAWDPDDEPPAAEIELLQTWWADGRARVAHAARTAGRDILATHGGLTFELAHRLRIADSDAATAAEALNRLPRIAPSPLWRAGVMMGQVEPIVGPLWAHAGEETATSWHRADAAPRFDQVVGHSMLFDWFESSWYLPPSLARDAQAYPDRRHARVDVGPMTLWAIDPTHLAEPAPAWEPLVVEG